MVFRKPTPSPETGLGDLFLSRGARGGDWGGVRLPLVDFDLPKGYPRLGPTLIRKTGRAFASRARQEQEQHRARKLPAWLVSRLLPRQVAAPSNEWDVVSRLPLGHLRDPSNTTNDVTELLAAAGFPWARSHTFRKTAATLLDNSAGLSARDVANQLGHKRASMTQDVYMSRHTVPEAAAEVL